MSASGMLVVLCGDAKWVADVVAVVYPMECVLFGPHSKREKIGPPHHHHNNHHRKLVKSQDGPGATGITLLPMAER